MTNCSRTVLLAAAAAALTTFAAGCGDDAPEAAVTATLNAAQEAPQPALANGALATIGDSEATEARLGYYAPERAAAFASQDGVRLTADQIARAVLGADGAKEAAAVADAQTAIQVGAANGATVITGPSGRIVRGGTDELAEELQSTTPPKSAIVPEAVSAVQSCLGDAAGSVIVGPAAVGKVAAAGASVIDTKDAPAGPKLVVCLAPHLLREVHASEHRLEAAFPAEGAPAGREPIIGEQEIGEREIVGATVALDQVDPALVRELLSGGDALLKLQLGNAEPRH